MMFLYFSVETNPDLHRLCLLRFLSPEARQFLENFLTAMDWPEFGRKVMAMEYHKNAKLCLWKRNFSGLMIRDWDKRKKERERENKKNKIQNAKEKRKTFCFSRAPPESSQVIKPLLETWTGRGHAKKTQKGFGCFSFFLSLPLVLAVIW